METNLIKVNLPNVLTIGIIGLLFFAGVNAVASYFTGGSN